MSANDNLELDFSVERRVLSVSHLNREARQLIERGFGSIWVEGEISNLSRPSSGHLYWSLKDTQAQVRCAMFRQFNRALSFVPDNGQQVLVRARVSLYEARGEFQLIVEHMEEAGEGLLRRRFEELKRKLAAEGLFDEARKKPLPRLPLRIGVVTSPTGAALRDVLTALKRRFPATAVLIYPTSVQGAAAAREICAALKLADRRRDCDLLILTRGGGSLEDLWPFNEEAVARAISAVAIPIIVGVGHEIDFTIADFAADMRAPTPSQAAELAVPERSEFDSRLSSVAAHLKRIAIRRLSDEGRRVAVLVHRLSRAQPGVALRANQQRLDELEGRLTRGLKQLVTGFRLRVTAVADRVLKASPGLYVRATAERIQRADERLSRGMRDAIERLRIRASLAERGLRSLSPLGTLERGYAIASRQDDRSLITDAETVDRGTAIDIRLARGRLAATVDSKLTKNK